MNIKEHIAIISMSQFSKQGIRVVTMDSLAKKLGISKRTLYENYSCKEELVLQCVFQDVASFEKMFVEKLTFGGSSMMCLVDIFTFLYEKSQTYNPAYIDDIHRNPELLQITERLREMIQENIEALFNQAVAEGDFYSKKDFNILSFLFDELVLKNFPQNHHQPVETFHRAIVAILKGLCTEKGQKALSGLSCNV